MNIKFLTTYFDDKKSLAKMQELEQGFASCEKCKSRIDIRECEPLSMGQCPTCNDLIFVPWRVADWWATKPIASGGFGAVYLGHAYDRPTERVAVKVLQKADRITAEVIENFQHECDIAYSLKRHPHLVDTYAVGEENNRAFMVQQFVDGTRLNELVINRGALLPSEECLYYGLDVASALQHIYEAGYIYRDVKPENVLITKDHMGILIDLGLCTPIEEAAQTRGDSVIGSPLYMAPERYLREGDDLRSDIYSLGMMLYFSIIGETFISPTELRQVMHGHTNKLRLPTGAKMARCEPDVINLVDHMIRRNRDERFSSYEELIEAIGTVILRLQQTNTPDPIIQSRRSHFYRTYVA